MITLAWAVSVTSTPPLLPLHPLVTIVVPCHNEGRDIEDTVEYLLATTYPNFDILLVNDGSGDETRQILDGLAAQYPEVRVIHCAHNQGKAVALTTAALMTPAQFKPFTAEMIARLRVSQEGQEGMDAFLNKRPPRWAADK